MLAPSRYRRLTAAILVLSFLFSSSMASLDFSSHLASAGHKAKMDLHLLATTFNGTVLPYTVDTKMSSFTRGTSSFASTTFGENPGWICYSPTFSSSSSTDAHRRMLYIVDGASSNIYAASLDTLDPLSLSAVGEPVSSNGIEPVSCVVGHGPSANTLFVANYGSGTMAYFRLDSKTGAIDAASREVYQFTRNGTGPVADRQYQSYAHQTQISHDGRWVYVCDLGADVIHRFQITPSIDKDQKAKVEYKGDTKVDAGSGPRHMTFYPSTTLPSNAKRDDATTTVHAYLASELSSTVTAFSYDADTGKLHQLGQPLFPFPPETPLSGPNILPTNRTTAEIEVSPDGRFVYVSNRGDSKEDHISIFRRDSKDGTIQFVEWVGSGGLLPRHFSLSSPSDGAADYLVSAHQNSQDLVLFKRDSKTGALDKLHKIKHVGVVVYAGFLPA